MVGPPPDTTPLERAAAPAVPMAHARIHRSRILPVAVIVAFGVGVLATAGFAAFAGEEAPARETPRASTRISEAERIAADIAELREGNQAALDALENAATDVDTLKAEWSAAAEEAPAPVRPSKPHVPRQKPKPKADDTKPHRPIEIDDDRNPLAGVR
jgi:hypothetical protein